MANDPMERIRKLEARVKQAEQRRKEEKARLAREKRKLDTRRKILLGTFLLHQSGGKVPDDWLRALDDFLTRDHDRAVFGLAPRGE